MVNAKQIWDTLKVSFEGDNSVRIGNIELLQGKIENFTMIEGETTQAMFDRFMTLINKIRALGDTRWDDNSPRKICRVYRQKNNMLASVIMERDNYTTMTPQEMLAKLMHHEVLDDEAKEASVLKKSIALTTSHGNESSHCHKGCCEHRHNNDDNDLDEEQALLVKNYTKYLRMKKEKMMRYGRNKPYRRGFAMSVVTPAILRPIVLTMGRSQDIASKVTRSTRTRREVKHI
jgi:hypothetical protein